MTSNKHLIADLYQSILKEGDIFIVTTKDHVPLVEGPTKQPPDSGENSVLYVFSGVDGASEYRTYLIGIGFTKELIVLKTNLDVVFGVASDLDSFSEESFGVPLKILLVTQAKSSDIVEDVIYSKQATIH
ncbi:hypothetical protein [Myxococcus phage Mx1]|nr:hypothetical protein [Myxococcus phage Mx1]